MVGTWEIPKGSHKRTYKSDGTFESWSRGSIRGYKNVEIFRTGTWRLHGDMLSSTNGSQRATRDGKPFPELFEEIGTKLGETHTGAIAWRDADSWTFKELKTGYYVRVKP
jgi:hypothetical protein